MHSGSSYHTLLLASHPCHSPILPPSSMPGGLTLGHTTQVDDCTFLEFMSASSSAGREGFMSSFSSRPVLCSLPAEVAETRLQCLPCPGLSAFYILSCPRFSGVHACSGLSIQVSLVRSILSSLGSAPTSLHCPGLWCPRGLFCFLR